MPMVRSAKVGSSAGEREMDHGHRPSQQSNRRGRVVGRSGSDYMNTLDKLSRTSKGESIYPRT